MPLSPSQQQEIRRRAADMMRDAGVVLHDHEQRNLELAGFGLDDFENQGLIVHIYVNTDRYCGKELVLLPHQACPEHRHPPVPEEDSPGKMETFRVRAGKVFLYLEGEGSRDALSTTLPDDHSGAYTVFRELILGPGDQHTIPPDTRHWFKAGDKGAVVTEFSSRSRDDLDVFTDQRVQRIEEANS